MIRIAVGFLLLLSGLAAPAQATDYYAPGYQPPPRTWGGALPVCEDAGVLGRIVEKFAYADKRVLFTGLAITQFDLIHESDIRAGGPSLIDRRYCRANAWLSNGERTEVVYLIEATQGFASIGWNVESCLPSFDPWRVYDSWCRSIRP